jgi:multidrug efflux pump
MNPSRIFILRPIGTSLLMIAVLLSGILAYKLLPVSALPNVDYPIIRIVTKYPGASPDIISSAITAPLEGQFGQMPGLNQMTSTSSTGISVVTLQFNLEVALDIAEQEVQAGINSANNLLPRELANPPIYSKVNPADTPIMTLALTSDILPLSQVEDLADTRLAQKISQVSGVGYVSISGGQRPAVRIQVDPAALAAKALTLEDIRSAISLANVNAPKGGFDGQYLAYTINSNDQLLSSTQYKNLIIAYQQGAPVRLQDVANIVDDVENVKQAAWMNNKPAIILNIQRQPGSNVIEVANNIKKLIPQIAANMPSSVAINIVSDRTISVGASIADAKFEMLLSILLVIVVIFVFLRNIPATIIPGVTVPLSLIGSLGIIYFLGFSLNNFTLMALTIATGFVVDDAIVMIENIARYIEEGMEPVQAALKGSGQIGFTIISLTVSLIAVLIPLLFMSDVIGRLFREFAVTLSITILLSAVVSLTLTPMMCAVLLKKSPSKDLAIPVQNSLLDFYKKTLHTVLGHPQITLVVVVLTVVLTALLLYIIPKGFFPTQDTGAIQAISISSPSSSFEAMAARQQILATEILKDPAVENLASFIGIDETNTTLNTGNILITLKPVELRKQSASEVVKRLQSQVNTIADIKLYMQPVQDLSVDSRISLAKYQYTIGATEASDVSKWSALLVDSLVASSIVAGAVSDLQEHGLQTLVAINRDAAARFGISARVIEDTLYDAFGQRQVSTMFTQLNQYHVILEVAPHMQRNSESLNNLYLKSAAGQMVPFNSLISVSEQIGAQLISRQNQFPVATISFNLQPGKSLGQAIDEINKIKQLLKMPASIQAGFAGAARVFESSLANEGWLVLAAIVVVYIVLGMLYESYIHPITILSTLPSATVGAMLALLALNYELSIIALIGIILLIGIVMKNAIIMIDFALELERIEKKSPYDAIFTSCILRVRPIIMTTMAALLGAVPLAFSSGMGSELRQPLGVAIIGGLLVSQLLTLYTTPVIYLLFDNLKLKLNFKSNPTSIPAVEA